MDKISGPNGVRYRGAPLYLQISFPMVAVYISLVMLFVTRIENFSTVLSGRWSIDIVAALILLSFFSPGTGIGVEISCCHVDSFDVPLRISM